LQFSNNGTHLKITGIQACKQLFLKLRLICSKKHILSNITLLRRWPPLGSTKNIVFSARS